MLKLIPLLAPILLAGCSKADNDPGPGGETMGEARALDEAAEMLKAQRLPPEAIPPIGQSTPAASDSNQPPNKTGG